MSRTIPLQSSHPGLSTSFGDVLLLKALRLISVKQYREPDKTSWEYFAVRLTRSKRFFERMAGHLDVKDKSVLDVGCGRGSTCVEAADRGATKVVGVDMQEPALRWAREELLPYYYPEHANRIDFRLTDGTLQELGDERFDVVISKDSFEHYENPEGLISTMIHYLKPLGVLAIGFGPPWKAPTGGHLNWMTKLPWVHLIFPERIVLQHRSRFFPDEHVARYEDIRGGLNRMTVGRFRQIMNSTELECIYYATNVSGNPIVRAMRLPASVPFLREYFTANAYGVWRAPSTN